MTRRSKSKWGMTESGKNWLILCISLVATFTLSLALDWIDAATAILFLAIGVLGVILSGMPIWKRLWQTFKAWLTRRSNNSLEIIVLVGMLIIIAGIVVLSYEVSAFFALLGLPLIIVVDVLTKKINSRVDPPK